jgi:phosphogluconate dehydratase
MTARHDIEAITERIRERSRASREIYLNRLAEASGRGANRAVLSCGNLAHGFAICSPSEKVALGGDRVPNLGIITAYNDMLSAHQPFETYPALIKQAAKPWARLPHERVERLTVPPAALVMRSR